MDTAAIQSTSVSGSGFNFKDALQKPTSFDFTATSQTSAQLTENNIPHGDLIVSSIATVPQDSKSLLEEEPPKFSQLYKTRGIKDAQKLRMEETLRRQKQKRYDYQNHVRQLTELLVDDEQLENETKMDSEQMDWNQERKYKRESRKKQALYFKNQLMLSEWFLEKPERFSEDWLMVAVPKGKRNLVIATGGHTLAYSKNGFLVNQFSSHLPGGGRHKHHWNTDTAIVDCIYNESSNTYFVLDMMFWKRTPMYDTETQFRFYWLHEKFQEVPEIVQISKQNPFRFEPLPNFSCDEASLSNVMHCEMTMPLDGFLFYHKATHYTFGYTPLVLWLQPYMVPEALGVMVPQRFIDLAPTEYKGFIAFREQCIAKLALREEAEQVRMEKRGTQRHQAKSYKKQTQDNEMREEEIMQT